MISIQGDATPESFNATLILKDSIAFFDKVLDLEKT